MRDYDVVIPPDVNLVGSLQIVFSSMISLQPHCQPEQDPTAPGHGEGQGQEAPGWVPAS